MSYTSKFKYNEAYDNSDIAEALSVITGSGIIPNTLNEILSEYATGGVTYADERLKVNISDTVLSVGCGAAVMNDGSYIIVYEPETFEISLSGTYYVYLQSHDVGDISVECGDEAPTNNYLLLASVNDGVLSDKRTYAKSKLTNYGKSSLQSLSVISSEYNKAAYTLPNYGFSAIIFIYKAARAYAVRAAVYDCDKHEFTDNCNMLYDTGTTGTMKSVSNVTNTDNILNVEFDNMSTSDIEKVDVYCV